MTTASPKTTRPKSGTLSTKTTKGAGSKIATGKPVATKAVGGKVPAGGSKVPAGEKKKKKVSEEEPKPTVKAVTAEVEVTISLGPEEKKEEGEHHTEIPPSLSIDTTPLPDQSAFTPSTATRVEQIISTQTSLSKELAEKLPRLSEALAAAGGDEEDQTKEVGSQPWPLDGTSVDKVDNERVEEPEGTGELEKEEPTKDVGAEEGEAQTKDLDDERAERKKVGSVLQELVVLLQGIPMFWTCLGLSQLLIEKCS